MVLSSHAPVLDIRHVTKVYPSKVRALDKVSLSIEPGKVFGLLGPNGAGKSTLVKILMGLIRPTEIDGELLGNKIGHKPSMKRVGFLPEHHLIPVYLTAEQAMHYFGGLSKVPRKTRLARIDGLLDRVGLLECKTRKVATFSKGMQQRLGIAQALINDPDLIVLDEPTDGLDPVGRRDVRDLLAQLKQNGKTILINSHLLSEVESVCDEVAILKLGNIIRQGTLAELTKTREEYEIQLPLATADQLLVAKSLAQKALAGTEAIVSDYQTRLFIVNASVEKMQGVIDILRDQNFTIASLSQKQASLEDIFIELVTDQPAEPAFYQQQHPVTPPPLPGFNYSGGAQ